MDKAIIFDVYDFVGFHICKALLNNGIEVEGIHADENVDESFLGEKRLEIGRNANFEELNFFTSKVQENISGKGTLIISFYDLFMLHKEHLLQSETIRDRFYQLFKEKKKINETIVFLLPIQMLSSSFNLPGISAIKHFIKLIEDIPNHAQFIFLPTIYGPWQPSTFLFQHAILSSLNKNSELKGIREATNDALFIDDAIGSILQIIEKGQTGKFVIETGEKDQWEKCAAYLNVYSEENVLRNTWRNQSDLIFVKPKKLTPISDSMSMQINHIKRYLQIEQ